MDLTDVGNYVALFKSRPFVGGKVSSWQDDNGNHIKMDLHIFFRCYCNLYGIMERASGFVKYL